MATPERIRAKGLLRESEGYLELGLPTQALEVLDRLVPAEAGKSHALYLRGEALRSLERHAEALESLAQAAELAPSHVPTWLALGWCHKRTGRLDRAIEALEQAEAIDDSPAVVLYNLACYWSLSREKERALSYLGRALTQDARFREMIADEADFDPLRDDPDFQALTSVAV